MHFGRCILACITFLASPASAQQLGEQWFLHKFGELRAYHGDWLSVCAENGSGPCRTVQTGKDPGSDAYFDNRIAVHRIGDTADWAVVVMDRGMPEQNLTRLWFEIDGQRFVPPSWSPGELRQSNVAETATLTDSDFADNLVSAMRAGNRMTVHYFPKGGGDGLSRYSLRGITAATNAIEARVLARQE